MGVNIFVYTKCDGGGVDWKHPGQEPTYLIPGVSTAPDAPKEKLSQGALAALAAAADKVEAAPVAGTSSGLLDGLLGELGGNR